jgi:tRNA(Leu) C34 or U34 (ribose-2'-O)-methylase TrmL
MGKSIKSIGKNKWLTLTPRQKHTALARFAIDCLKKGDFGEFIGTYNTFTSWSPIDQFKPPHWLNHREKLENFFYFHQKLSGKPPHYFRKASTTSSMTWEPKLQVTVALDQVFSPFNIGSVLRIIDNFGFAGLIHSTPQLDLNHQQLKKSARGTENWIPVKFIEDLPDFLKSSPLPVIGLEQTDEALLLNKWQPPESFILVLGNEVYGISKNILNCCDCHIHIPMKGFKNSMNLSHALAIAAYHIQQNQII